MHEASDAWPVRRWLHCCRGCGRGGYENSLHHPPLCAVSEDPATPDPCYMRDGPLGWDASL
jgi:hypothetical protein